MSYLIRLLLIAIVISLVVSTEMRRKSVIYEGFENRKKSIEKT